MCYGGGRGGGRGEVADTEGEMLMAEVASIDIMASSPGEVRTSG